MSRRRRTRVASARAGRARDPSTTTTATANRPSRPVQSSPLSSSSSELASSPVHVHVPSLPVHVNVNVHFFVPRSSSPIPSGRVQSPIPSIAPPQSAASFRTGVASASLHCGGHPEPSRAQSSTPLGLPDLASPIRTTWTPVPSSSVTATGHFHFRVSRSELCSARSPESLPADELVLTRSAIFAQRRARRFSFASHRMQSLIQSQSSISHLFVDILIVILVPSIL